MSLYFCCSLSPIMPLIFRKNFSGVSVQVITPATKIMITSVAICIALEIIRMNRD